MAENVEKRADEVLLHSGRIVLTERETLGLELAAHSEDLLCRFGAEEFSISWHAPTRALSGELLMETLQLNASVGSLVRLSRTSWGLELGIVDRGSSTLLMPSSTYSQRPTQTIIPPRPLKVPKRTGRRAVRFQLAAREDFDWRGAVGFHRPSLENLAKSAASGGWDPKGLFDLRVHGEELAAVNDFDELMAPALAKVEQMPHQEATARQVLGKMRGRAILADEVGLGKTIEAGLVLKELVLRGLVRRVLVLCPATLREQWRSELETKFDEQFEIVFAGYERPTSDKLIMSLHLARMNTATVTKKPWDLLIVDEAHKAGGAATQKLIEAIEARYRLFLTATPVQNDLAELHRLVEQIRPGTFSSLGDFKSRFVDKNDKTKPKDPAALRKLVSDVMVRTTREQAGLDKVQRHPIDVAITLSKQEMQLYRLCTDGLRLLMQEPGDHLRVRSLAVRLTASPRSLAITARKIAGSHADPRVREFLTDVADLALDLKATGRQSEMTRIVSDWVDPRNKSTSGKAIVFTQHYDTLDDLVRVLGEAGIHAEPYHGGLSSAAKQRAIQAFNDRDTQVLVSTDAGAEGLNLQVANCVLNYDLPWNPMRIEQRIGRVHRLTQQRDTVYVANLFAKGTIDERVYRILHDKLRMFELLFGQVTTILGEINESADSASTFEGEILRALVARSDGEMDRRLDMLGAKVHAAYQAAQTMVADAGSVNSWAFDKSHRSGLRGSPELVPAVRKRRSDRQQKVQAFVQDYLGLTGAVVEFEQPGFLSATVNPALAELLGRDALHLAFGPEGLEHHRDAELCAVGSEVFEDLVASLEDLGDLNASMPTVPSNVPQEAWVAHDPTLRLVSRRVLGPTECAGEAVWRVATEGDHGDEILRVPFGDPVKRSRSAHVELAEADQWPESLPEVEQLLDLAVDATVAPLEDRIAEVRRRNRKAIEEEKARLTANADERIGELQRQRHNAYGRTRIAELDRQLDQLKKARARHASLTVADPEARASLLALRVTGHGHFQVEERWVDGDDREFQLYAEWNPSSKSKPRYLDPDGLLISVLRLCDCGTPTDAATTDQCPGCRSISCSACPPVDRRRMQCPVCRIPHCLSCFHEETGLCPGCSSPKRESSADRDGMVAWRLGSDVELLVGERVAYVASNGEQRILVPDTDLAHPMRKRLRLLAERRGARADLGCQFESPTATVAPQLVLSRTVQIEDVLVEGAGADADRRASPHLAAPDGPDPAEEEGDFARLLARLRAVEAPMPAPALLLEAVEHVTALDVVDGSLVVQHHVNRPNASPTSEQEGITVLSEGRGDTVGSHVLSNGDRLSVERVHRSYRITVEGTSTRQFFVPGNVAVTEGSEEAVAAHLRRIDWPSASATIGPIPQTPDRFADPHGVRLLRREVQWELVPGDEGDSDGWIGPEGVALLKIECEPASSVPVPSRRLGDFLDALHALDDAADLPTPARLEPVVTETWRRGVIQREVMFRDPSGDAWLPSLDDGAPPASDFGLCDGGHLFELGTPQACPLCHTLRCRACPPETEVTGCPDCARPVCGACQARGAALPSERCGRCDAVSCPRCTRVLDLASCTLCARRVCGECATAGLCSDCCTLADAPISELPSPPWLYAGASVIRRLEVGERTLLSVAGFARRELVVLEGQELMGWWSISEEDERRSRLRFGLAAPNVKDAAVRVVYQELDPPTPPEPVGIVLQTLQRPALDWELKDADGELIVRSAQIVGESAEALLGSLTESLAPKMPQEAPPPLRQVLDPLIPASATAPTAVLVITAMTLVERLEVGAIGLTRLTQQREALMADTSPWLETTSDPAYRPAPENSWVVHLDGYRCRLAKWGPYLALRTTDPGGSTDVLRLDSETVPMDLAVALADRTGRSGSAVAPSQCLEPHEIVHLQIPRATRTEASIVPVFIEGGSHCTALALKLVRQWVEGHALAIPSNAPKASPAVRTQFSDVFADASTLQVGMIGLRVTEQWARGSLSASCSYVVTPEQRQALVEAADTGHAVSKLHLDASGHFVEKVSHCAGCGRQTCESCAARTRACELCGIELCGNCEPRNAEDTESPYRCDACSSLKVESGLKSRISNRRFAKVLAGSSRVQALRIMLDKNGSVTIGRQFTGIPYSEQPMPLSAMQAEILNDCCGNASFSTTPGAAE